MRWHITPSQPHGFVNLVLGFSGMLRNAYDLHFFYLKPTWITYLAHYIFLSQLVHGTFLSDTLCRIFAFPYLKGFVTVTVLRGHVQLWELWRLTFQLGSEKCDTIVSCKCGAKSIQQLREAGAELSARGNGHVHLPHQVAAKEVDRLPIMLLAKLPMGRKQILFPLLSAAACVGQSAHRSSKSNPHQPRCNNGARYQARSPAAIN